MVIKEDMNFVLWILPQNKHKDAAASMIYLIINATASSGKLID